MENYDIVLLLVGMWCKQYNIIWNISNSWKVVLAFHFGLGHSFLLVPGPT